MVGIALNQEGGGMDGYSLSEENQPNPDCCHRRILLRSQIPIFQYNLSNLDFYRKSPNFQMLVYIFKKSPCG